MFIWLKSLEFVNFEGKPTYEYNTFKITSSKEILRLHVVIEHFERRLKQFSSFVAHLFKERYCSHPVGLLFGYTQNNS